MIKVTTKEEMFDPKYGLEEIVQKFEAALKKEDKNKPYYHLVISGEYHRSVLNEVEALYKSAGWTKVICKTSSEGGERPGLTGLQLHVF